MVGAAGIVFGVGVALFLGLATASDQFANGLEVIRSAALTLVALILLATGLRHVRPRHRKAVALPAWLTPRTAVVVGVLATGADLPNAFPYFIAVERLVTADVSNAVGLAVIAAYTLIYCLPCMILLALGAWRGERIRARLQGLYDRFGTARDVPASFPKAIAYVVAAAAVLWFAYGR